MEVNEWFLRQLNYVFEDYIILKKRLTFSNLSGEIIIIANVFGVQDTAYIVYCPMTNGNKGFGWICF